MTLKLYFAAGSSAFAALVALEEAHAEYEAVGVALARGEQKGAEYLKINPRGRVPALDVGSRIITENLAVLTYIAASYPQVKLLPFEDPVMLARAYELLSWFASSVHIEVAKMWRSERFTDDATANAAVEASGRSKFGAAVAELETIAADEPSRWLLSDQFTVVDAFSLVVWRWTQRLEMDPKGFPRFAELAARAFERPAVRCAIERERSSAGG